MDISATTQPRSDQLNYDDVSARSITATIAEVRKGTAEQPVEIHLTEFPGRPYKPSKSMRRVLVAAWGAEASTYTGRRITLYGDPEVTFGREKVGGIKIAALSDIDAPLSIALTVTRGRRAPFTVQPLTTPAPNMTLAVNAITSAKDATELDKLEKLARERGIQDNPAVKAAIDKKREELT